MSRTGVDTGLYEMISHYKKGIQFNKQNEFKKAIHELNESLRYAEIMKNTEMKFNCYMGLGYAMFKLNKYSAAKNMYTEANHIFIGTSEVECYSGMCDQYSGNIDSAKIKYIQALNSARNPTDSLRVLNLSGVLNHQTGDYIESMKNFEIALSLLDRADSTSLKQNALMNFGNLNFALNNTAKAFSYYDKAFSEATESDDLEGAAIVLSNRGSLLSEQEKTDSAISCYESALKLLNTIPSFKKNKTKDIIFIRLAQALEQQEQFNEANAMLENLLQKVDTQINPFIKISLLINLGNVKNSLKEYDKGLKYFQDAISFLDSSKLNSFEFSIAALYGLSISYEGLNNPEQAALSYIQLSGILKEQIQNQLLFFSENDRSKYIQSTSVYFDAIKSFAYRQMGSDSAINSLVYDNNLLLKDLITSSARTLVNSLIKHSDTKTQQLYNEWKVLKISFAFQQSLPIDKREIDIYELEEKANTLERKLMEQSDVFKTEKEKISLNWKNIRNHLNPAEAAVDFIKFQNFRNELKKETIYCALILRNDYTFPKLVYLFKEPQLQQILNRNTKETYESDKLYNCFWSSIESSLKNIKTVYFSPAGLLHKVSFKGIKMPDEQYLIAKYNLNLLSNTRQIVFKKPDLYLADITTAYLYGGIDYNDDPLEKNLSPDLQPSRNDEFNFLKESLLEVNNAEILLKNYGINTQIFTGKNATEESLKKIINNKTQNILHISTHGSYISESINKNKSSYDSNEPFYYFSIEPSLRSLLKMAGAKRILDTNTLLQMPSGNEGILTAYEVANIDLSTTKLVVLSACETGLGDINGNEEVYGLQRSFKISGVDFIITSLWKVNDSETSELMQSFYKKWTEGTTVKKAFNDAQLEMKEKNNSFDWAAFIIIE